MTHRLTDRPTARRALALFPLLAISLAGCDRLQRQKELEGSPYARQLAEAVPRVERVAGMKFKHPPALAMRSKTQVREYVKRQFDETAPASEMAGREAVYKRLGAVPDTLHLRDMYVDLLEEQVVGYYDPKLDTLYVVEGSDESSSGVVITHELVHALQDQYVNLDSIMAQRGDDDRAGAAQSVIEGQAMYWGLLAMTDPGLINLTTNWDLARQRIRESRNASPRMAAAPLVVQEGLIFPYLSGADFVRRYIANRPGKNPLLEPPRSTEQVMHAEAYFGAKPDLPTRVTLDGVAGVTYDNVIGEFETRVILYEQLRDQGTATRAAQGWDGDRVAVTRGDASGALVWASVWDTAVDANEFLDAVAGALALRYGAATPSAGAGGTRSFTSSGRSVTVTTGEVSGRPVVLVVDVPAGAAPLATLANVRVGEDGSAGR